jgi:hypothetical protein
MLQHSNLFWTMKNRIIIAVLLAIFLIVGWFGLMRYDEPKTDLKPMSPARSPDVQAANLGSGPSVATQTANVLSLQNSHAAEVAREHGVWMGATMTPIKFFGEVVDEHQKPVAGAIVSLTTADHPYSKGTNYSLISDENGRFSIAGAHGLGLSVAVSKEGYYSTPNAHARFGYANGAGGLPPHVNPADPAIFVLRKMGLTEPLIVVRRQISLNKNGAPVLLDIHTGKVGGATGDIRFRISANDSPGTRLPYDWSSEIEVPSGGLMKQSGDQFDFVAPNEGYQNADEISMPAGASHWRDSVNNIYFVKLPSGEFGRIEVGIAGGGDNFVSIVSYLNPIVGDQNLEYNSSKAINR